MATQDAVKAVISGDQTTQKVMVKQERIEQLLGRIDVKKRFDEILGKRAPGFISSIISAVKTNPNLSACDPMSVISSAVIAATLDLPINSNLGFAHIVPYSGKAQFQMGWKGFVQLAIRTGQYKTMNAAEVYEGELRSWNRITGEIDIDLTGRKSNKAVGYVAFFRLVNGFEKYVYMTREEVEEHARRYSKSYSNKAGQWSQNFNVMALKTVLKLLLSKYGILSVDMQRALAVDQAVITPTVTGDVMSFDDQPENDKVIPVESLPQEEVAA